ncbi:MAG: hypothetical protein AB1442_12110, partial [Nitrospirota bacterium]
MSNIQGLVCNALEDINVIGHNQMAGRTGLEPATFPTSRDVLTRRRYKAQEHIFPMVGFQGCFSF